MTRRFEAKGYLAAAYTSDKPEVKVNISSQLLLLLVPTAVTMSSEPLLTDPRNPVDGGDKAETMEEQSTADAMESFILP